MLQRRGRSARRYLFARRQDLLGLLGGQCRWSGAWKGRLQIGRDRGFFSHWLRGSRRSLCLGEGGYTRNGMERHPRVEPLVPRPIIRLAVFSDGEVAIDLLDR